MNFNFFKIVSGYIFLGMILSANVCAAGWKETLMQKVQTVSQARLDDTQIGKGLKEALSVGIDQAVASASQNGGYLDNSKIRIRLPQSLASTESFLRKIGLGAKLDEFEKSMNQAAEKAAPSAKSILLEAVFGMSIQDVQAVWKGGDTAATQYFRGKSEPALRQSFLPVMTQALNRYSVSQKYNQLAQAYQKIPLPSKPKLVPVEDYATQKALDGLFTLLADEEKKIRTDPKARVTDLLKKVFSNSGLLATKS